MARRKSFHDPHPVDVHVGQRVRERRVLLGMSQQKLGEALGITFQQVQKYERGANRISSSRLFCLSETLDVPISYFFEGYSRSSRTDDNYGLGTRSLRLARYFSELSDNQRDAVFQLVKSLAQPDARHQPIHSAK